MASGLTPTYLLPYPLQTDAVDVAGDAELLADATETALLAKAPLSAPAFTGIPTAPTAGSDTSTTQLATTQFVINQGYLKSSLASSTYSTIASPTFTGVPLAPTASLGTNTNQLATTSFVANALNSFVTLPSQTGANGKFIKSDGSVASWQTITTGDVSGLSTVINGLSSTYSPLNLTINTQLSGYTLVLSDSAKQIEMNSLSVNSLLIPTDASVAFPIGTTIIVVQLGTGQTTISAATPATTTLRFTPGNKLRTQNSTATLVKRAANDWILSGDLIA
jgi:hypothetical protein